LGPGGVDPKVLIARLEEEQEEVSVKRAILLSLGEFGLDRLPLAERRNFLSRLLQLYRDEPDSGIHGAAEWLLRKWEGSDEMKKIDKGLASGKVEGKRQWYVNGQGHTMVVVPKPGEFWMGEGKERHRRRIDRSFAIGSKEVTSVQFYQLANPFRNRKTRKNNWMVIEIVGEVSWYDAAAYCNWLSKEEGIPYEQWCYLPNGEGKYDEGMKMAPNYLKRTGYRLPTEAEWEYSCRAGADTGYSFGGWDGLIFKYGWFGENSLGKRHPVGLLKPNDLGLFDMHGNVYEWCQDVFKEYGKGDGKAIEDIEEIGDIKNNIQRVCRGGSFNDLLLEGRGHSAHRDSTTPLSHPLNLGFRLARTITP